MLIDTLIFIVWFADIESYIFGNVNSVPILLDEIEIELRN